MMLTIAYLTFRLRPRFEWFASSLDREFRSMPDVSRDSVQIVVVDGRLWYDERHRHLGMLDACAGRFPFEHVPPKPCRWQGPSRLTSRDFFAAANARNTALMHAKGDHVCFVDDLSVLLPGWLKAHVHAAQHGYVLAGTTCKNKNIVVSGAGEILSYDIYAPGQDTRLKLVTGDDVMNCPGEWLYGGTFSVPMAAALNVNGQDEIHDSIGGEDYDFGIRLARAGVAICISRSCGTMEDEDGHHAEMPMVRLDKPWPGSDGPYSSNYLLNRLHREQSRTWTIGNEFSLREMRASVASGQGYPVVSPEGRHQHWVDGQLLAEL
jgi:hypothetical protein